MKNLKKTLSSLVESDFVPLEESKEGLLLGGFGSLADNPLYPQPGLNNCQCAGNNCDCLKQNQKVEESNNCSCSVVSPDPYGDNCNCGEVTTTSPPPPPTTTTKAPEVGFGFTF